MTAGKMVLLCSAIAGALLGVLFILVMQLLLRFFPTIGGSLVLLITALLGVFIGVYGVILYRFSILDDTTGIYNRRHIFRRIQREWKKASKSGSALALAVIDVDDFRKYNNEYGHMAGDVVLQSIAQALQMNIRKADIIGRWGGEEFAVIFPGVTATDVQPIVERLRSAVNLLVLQLEGKSTASVSVSIGVTAYLAEDSTYGILVKRADRAMYKAKEIKNHIVIL